MSGTAADQHDRDPESDQRAARRFTLIAATLGFAVIQLDVTVVNVAIKAIGSALGGQTTDLQWVISSYTLMFAALILSGGALGDRLGAKRVFTGGFILFVVASMACGLAPSLGVLIAARAVQGVGAAALGSCSLALVSHTFPDDRERRRAVGLWAAGASSALSGGPVLGGVLIATLGWRAIFFINVPIGIVGVWLIRRYAQETPRAPGRGLDLPGQIFAVIGLAAFAGSTIEAGAHGLTDPWVIAGYVVFLIAGAGFLTVESRSARPMLPLSLFRHRRFTSSSLIGMLINVTYYGLIFIFSLLFQEHLGYSALRAGLAFLPMTVAMVLVNVISPLVVDRIGSSAAILRTRGAHRRIRRPAVDECRLGLRADRRPADAARRRPWNGRAADH